MSITRKKIRYLVVLNKKFLTLLASDLLLQIEQVLSQIGISMSLSRRYWFFVSVVYISALGINTGEIGKVGDGFYLCL
ncbi:hypothetical protein EAG18_05810 [Pseudoalteromonas sp. J010]|nr:hypothetical protein EAG18_05810 [Pseudoalteromonas sp. J010]